MVAGLVVPCFGLHGIIAGILGCIHWLLLVLLCFCYSSIDYAAHHFVHFVDLVERGYDHQTMLLSTYSSSTRRHSLYAHPPERQFFS
jgi:hypothetical protein